MTETELEDRLRTAEPIVQRIVQSRLRHSPFQQDRGDVCSEACLDLLRRLRESPEIQDFASYAATVAHHACDRYYRNRSPLRHRLKNRLRYLTAHDARFALWTGAEQRPVCGFSAWRGGAPVAPQLVAGAGGQLDALATAAFRACGGPLFLDDLVEIAAPLLGIRHGETAIDAVPLAVVQSRSAEQKSTSGAGLPDCGRRSCCCPWHNGSRCCCIFAMNAAVRRCPIFPPAEQHRCGRLRPRWRPRWRNSPRSGRRFRGAIWRLPSDCGLRGSKSSTCARRRGND
ncbi:MAG: sigma-70 family RNA polymerase sigma factor [Bryobacterales bacterium]|nr:sigma-70 family RNA polymerase sigma factor [Bryobacterales bacterium]